MNSSSLSPGLRPRTISHELRRREVEVVRINRLSPNFMAVTFGGAQLAGFTSESFEDHIKLILPGGGGGEIRRDYTPRRFDPTACELTLEIGLHSPGPGADWARQAAPGQRAVIGGPRGSLVIPHEYDWHLLIGDATALPAIHRRLEELPSGARAIVRVLMSDGRDRRIFLVPAHLDIEWIEQPEDLLESLRRWSPPAGNGFAWAAGEGGTMNAVKSLLSDEKGLSRAAMRIGAYWKKGDAGFHAAVANPDSVEAGE